MFRSFIAAALIAMGATASFARDLDGRYADSPLKPWFNQLKSSKGLCCSVADGASVEDPDWQAPGQGDNPTSRYRVRLQGVWVEVPDDALITEPNLAGKTMVWPVNGPNGSVWIRCFMPGTMT